MSSKSRQQLEAWLKTIEVKGSVIDFGGSQNPIMGRTKTWEVGDTKDDYLIVDLLEPHETKRNQDLVFDLNYETDFPITGYADIGFAIEIMEYMFNPFQALKNMALFLKKGGILYLSTHQLYGLHKPVGLDYMRYTKYGIEKLLKETGFEIEEIVPRTITPEGRQALDEFYHCEGMRILYNEETYKCGYLIKAKKI